MTTAFIDTNAILRYLTNDLPDQANRVEKRLHEVQQGDLQLIVMPVVIVEVVYHLTHWYRLDRSNTAVIVRRFLSESGVVVQDEKIISKALELFAETTTDLVDLFLWGSAKSNKAKVLSFDQDFDKLSPKLRLVP